MTNMNAHILNNYQAAVHSIIKEFVLVDGLNEDQRLARIAVIHAVMDAPEGNLGAYTKALLDILTEGHASMADAREAVQAVKKLTVSGMEIITDYRLNEFGLALVHSIAEAVTLVMPERFLPMHSCTKAPDYADFTTLNIEQTAVVKTPLVKNKLQISRKVAPNVFRGLDKLWKEQYTLNPDIMELINLPSEFLIRQAGMSISPAFADTFSFRFTFDHRGRAYSRSMHATPQGDSFSKAVLKLGTSKPLGCKGLNALAIHYANVSGHDKISLQARIEWAKTKGMDKAEFMVMQQGDWSQIAILLEAKSEKKGFEEYAAAMEFFRAMMCAIPAMFESNLIVHQDATNSGFQFGAALLGDRVAAEATNLLASHYSEAPRDLYQRVANSMLEHLPENLITTWTIYVNRSTVKKAVMVTGYGAGKKAQLKAFKENLIKEGYNHMADQADDVRRALELALMEHAGSLLALTAAMKQHATSFDSAVVSPQNYGKISWITQDGFKVYHDYQEEEAYGTGKYKVIATRNAGSDKEKNSSALPPNFIHSIDGNMLRLAALKADKLNLAFVPIHDSFGTHACDYFELGHCLREAFIEVMEYNWYNVFCTSNNFEPKITRTNGFKLTEVRASTYMFS